MFIDKNELNFENSQGFDKVKGLKCRITIFITPISNDEKALTAGIETNLSDKITEKLRPDILNCYNDLLKNEILNAKIHAERK